MNGLLNTLIRWGIIASISDKEAFVKSVAAVLEEYNPVHAEKIARFLAASLEDTKEGMNMNRIIKKFLADNNFASKKDIEELHTTIHRLMKELQELKQNKTNV